MKIVSIVLTVIAIGLVAYNVTELNFNNLMAGQSMIALITIITALCAIMLLQILRMSKRIEKLSKQRRNV